MKFIKAHIWMHETYNKIQRNNKFSFGDFMIEQSNAEYMKVLMEDGLMVFGDGKYIITEKGQDIIDTIDAYREL